MEAAFRYFKDKRSKLYGKTPVTGKGRLHAEPASDGLYYHGGRNHTFVCWSKMKEFGRHKDTKIVLWNPDIETLEKPGAFCCHHEKEGVPVAPNARRYQCLGHETPDPRVDPRPEGQIPVEPLPGRRATSSCCLGMRPART